MILYGASGHSKVIIDIVESRAEQTIDFIIDDNKDIKEVFGYKVEHKFRNGLKNEPLVIAVGNNQVRKKIADKFKFTYSEALIHKIQLWLDGLSQEVISRLNRFHLSLF